MRTRFDSFDEPPWSTRRKRLSFTLFLPLFMPCSSPPRLNELPSEQLEWALLESVTLPWAELPPAKMELASPDAPLPICRFLATKLRSLQIIYQLL
jgi:hypothetical protein